jgi:hypothetical protein
MLCRSYATVAVTFLVASAVHSVSAFVPNCKFLLTIVSSYTCCLIVVWAVVEVMHTFLHWVCEDAKIPFLDRHRYNRRGDSGLNGILDEYLWKGHFGNAVMVMLF